MAKKENSEDRLMANESPLAKAQAKTYVAHQARADFYKNMSSYMFWGATSVMAAVVGLGLGMFTAPVALGFTATMAIGAIASVGTFLGSVMYSRKATQIAEKSNVLYSDIDSQNQARRMVQAFAKAQSQDAAPDQAAETPMTAPGGKSWVESVGGSKAAGTGNWQSRVVAQADREDAIAMQNLR